MHIAAASGSLSIIKVSTQLCYPVQEQIQRGGAPNVTVQPKY